MANSINLGHPRLVRLKRCQTNGVEDRISALPDEILSLILKFLTLKEAIATSILSKRWENLWVSYPSIDLEFSKRHQVETFVHSIDKLLGKFNGHKLHKFRIFSPILEKFGSNIDNWISLAIRNGVSELELSLDVAVDGGRRNYYYVPAHVFGGEGEDMSILKPCASPSLNVTKHLESLRDLSLRCVNMCDEVFDMILSRCFSLERFLLMNSLGIVNAKNTVPHMKLKLLELYTCLDLEKLELLAPNLESFNYQGKVRTLCIKDAQQLASLKLSGLSGSKTNSNTSGIFPRGKDFVFSQFSSYLPKLESFFVAFRVFEDMIDFREFCAFRNLRHLVLDVYFSFLFPLAYQAAASIIREVPYLEILELFLTPILLENDGHIQALESTSMSACQNLKEVKLFGFRGDANTLKFLDYIQEYVVSLRKIYVSARHVSVTGDTHRIFNRRPFLSAEEVTNLKKGVLHLRQSLHENVQLVIDDGEQCLEFTGGCV